jgi:elongation factor G
MGHPELILFRTIEALTESGQETLDLVLGQLEAEDPAFRFARDTRTGETLIYGTSEAHLEGIVDRLWRELGLEILNIGEPRVMYRETIRKIAEAEGKFIRQVGGRGQYAHVVIRLAPREAGSGFQFFNDVPEGTVPRKYVNPVEQGAREAMAAGILAGFELVDICVTLIDASYHEEDSSEMAFRMAASEAFREAALQASPVLLEPVLAVEVVAPDIILGSVVNDLTRRGARIEAIERRGSTQAIMATVPLSRMLGYGVDLASRTGGSGTYFAQFDHYQPLPDGHAPNDEENGLPVVAPRNPRPGRQSKSSDLS